VVLPTVALTRLPSPSYTKVVLAAPLHKEML
jgi:hypothetical protein